MRYMVDPPSGWKYGFPKSVPSEHVVHYGGEDYGLSDDFDLVEWIISEGYPQKELDNCGGNLICRHWYEKNPAYRKEQADGW